MLFVSHGPVLARVATVDFGNLSHKALQENFGLIFDRQQHIELEAGRMLWPRFCLHRRDLTLKLEGVRLDFLAAGRCALSCASCLELSAGSTSGRQSLCTVLFKRSVQNAKPRVEPYLIRPSP